MHDLTQGLDKDSECFHIASQYLYALTFEIQNFCYFQYHHQI